MCVRESCGVSRVRFAIVDTIPSSREKETHNTCGIGYVLRYRGCSSVIPVDHRIRFRLQRIRHRKFSGHLKTLTRNVSQRLGEIDTRGDLGKWGKGT